MSLIWPGRRKKPKCRYYFFRVTPKHAYFGITFNKSLPEASCPLKTALSDFWAKWKFLPEPRLKLTEIEKNYTFTCLNLVSLYFSQIICFKKNFVSLIQLMQCKTFFTWNTKEVSVNVKAALLHTQQWKCMLITGCQVQLQFCLVQ